MLWRFGQERQPAATPPPQAELHLLCDLLMARHRVVEQITAFGLRQSLLSAQAKRRLAQVVRALGASRLALERELEQWLEGVASAPWRDKVQTLCLAPGVNTLSALALIGYLPELGTLNRRQIAKLAGLAPLPDDSGTIHGQRCIRGGRAPVRRVLYQCAVVAARWHAATRAHYRQLRARGKPAAVAYVAIARKLLTYLNSLLRPAHAVDREHA